MAQIFCPTCSKHTEQSHLVDKYATQCSVCQTLVAGHERVQTEANVYYAPDGSQGVLVKNDPKTAIFAIEQGEYRGYYFYDKQTGFGGMQKR